MFLWCFDFRFFSFTKPDCFFRAPVLNSLFSFNIGVVFGGDGEGAVIGLCSVFVLKHISDSCFNNFYVKCFWVLKTSESSARRQAFFAAGRLSSSIQNYVAAITKKKKARLMKHKWTLLTCWVATLTWAQSSSVARPKRSVVVVVTTAFEILPNIVHHRFVFTWAANLLVMETKKSFFRPIKPFMHVFMLVDVGFQTNTSFLLRRDPQHCASLLCSFVRLYKVPPQHFFSGSEIL